MIIKTIDVVKAISCKAGSWVYGIGKLDVDKNPIYENDIVEAKTPYGKLNKTIVWDNDRCGYFLQSDFVAYDPKNYTV